MTSSPRRVFTIRATSGSARLPEDFLYPEQTDDDFGAWLKGLECIS
jgi:hypothetical protein